MYTLFELFTLAISEYVGTSFLPYDNKNDLKPLRRLTDDQTFDRAETLLFTRENENPNCLTFVFTFSIRR